MGIDPKDLKDLVPIAPLIPLAPKLYDDLAHPSLKEIGETVGRAVKIALSPANGALWTLEQGLEWVKNEATKRLAVKNTPVEVIQPPSPVLLGRVVVGVQGTGGEPSLNAMFANLLATAMDERSAGKAHPAFAGIIGQMLPDEARIVLEFAPRHWIVLKMAWPVELRTFTGPLTHRTENIYAVGKNCENQQDTKLYLDNLVRLGLLRYEVEDGPQFGEEERYLESMNVQAWALRARPYVENWVRKEAEERRKHGNTGLQIQYVQLTEFGVTFLEACCNVEVPREPDGKPLT